MTLGTGEIRDPLDGNGQVSELAPGADSIIGRSVPEAFSVDDVSAMADDASVLALANSDFPNQRVVPAVAAAGAGPR